MRKYNLEIKCSKYEENEILYFSKVRVIEKLVKARMKNGLFTCRRLDDRRPPVPLENPRPGPNRPGSPPTQIHLGKIHQ